LLEARSTLQRISNTVHINGERLKQILRLAFKAFRKHELKMDKVALTLRHLNTITQVEEDETNLEWSTIASRTNDYLKSMYDIKMKKFNGKHLGNCTGEI
jgi:hypothetical protein